MSKKNILIISALLLVVIAAAVALVLYNRDYAVVACKDKDGGCSYKEINHFGNIKYQTEFKIKEIIQCNIETIYKKGPDDIDVIDTYDFHMYFMTDKEPLNFKTKQRDNLNRVCTDIYERKPFEYKFPITK